MSTSSPSVTRRAVRTGMRRRDRVAVVRPRPSLRLCQDGTGAPGSLGGPGAPELLLPNSSMQAWRSSPYKNVPPPVPCKQHTCAERQSHTGVRGAVLAVGAPAPARPQDGHPVAGRAVQVLAVGAAVPVRPRSPGPRIRRADVRGSRARVSDIRLDPRPAREGQVAVVHPSPVFVPVGPVLRTPRCGRNGPAGRAAPRCAGGLLLLP